MQLAADRLAAWADEWCVAINKEKSSTTLFTLSSKQKTGTIKLGDTPLRSDDEATYLGVTFDKKQTWKPHIHNAEAKARRKLAPQLGLQQRRPTSRHWTGSKTKPSGSLLDR
ncbi:hypothetical protein V1264_013078 [Littorina saxatilis]|uniref:Uncharacterized protein n=1 Tax=Littorina saxatilis TaxID=31220 RepID=A0AAN9BPP0_9CAEN